jgi:hypothetical protein
MHAYTDIRVPVGQTAEGIPVRWDLNNIAGRPNIQNRRILYYIDDAGTVDAGGFLGPVNEFDAVQTAFNNWRDVPESELDFESAGSLLNAQTDAQDNLNVIRWDSVTPQTDVFAVTITTFDVTSAQITDADMELNDRDFTWDTLGNNTIGVPGRAYIENIVTHELGHVVGLDHPGNAQTSMFFASTSGAVDQTVLKHDDRAAIIRDYSHPTISNPDLATVSGSVDDGSGPVFGAEVVFVNAQTHAVMTSVLTEGPNGPFTNGDYTVANIPPGDYIAFAQPVDTNTLGSYYSSAYTSFTPIARGVAAGTAGTPTYVQVTPGGTVAGIDLTLPASQNPFEPDGTFGTATPIANGEVAVAYVGVTTDIDYYSFSATAGQIANIRILADGLGSTLNPVLTVFDTDGTTVLASPVFGHPNYVSGANDIDEIGFDLSGVNFDSAVSFTAPSTGTFYFSVASRISLTAGHYLAALELEGVNTTASAAASEITASVPGINADGTSTFTISVTPRNVHGEILSSTSFAVDLLDVTSGINVLQSTTSSAPFDFTVTAAASSQLVQYSADIGGVQVSKPLAFSHYATLSTTNSDVIAFENTITANGMDRITLAVELVDGGGNPFVDSTTSVTFSATMGTLDNGSTTGTANVTGVFDADTGWWFIELIGPSATGTTTVTGFANSVQVGNAVITVLPRAAGTGGGGNSGPSTPSDDDSDDGGGCATVQSQHVYTALLLGLLGLLCFVRRVHLNRQKQSNADVQDRRRGLKNSCRARACVRP